jgi:hypothetical protein
MPVRRQIFDRVEAGGAGGAEPLRRLELREHHREVGREFGHDALHFEPI